MASPLARGKLAGVQSCPLLRCDCHGKWLLRALDVGIFESGLSHPVQDIFVF